MTKVRPRGQPRLAQVGWRALARRPGQPRALYLPRCPISLDKNDLKIATPLDSRFTAAAVVVPVVAASASSKTCALIQSPNGPDSLLQLSAILFGLPGASTSDPSVVGF